MQGFHSTMHFFLYLMIKFINFKFVCLFFALQCISCLSFYYKIASIGGIVNLVIFWFELFELG